MLWFYKFVVQSKYTILRRDDLYQTSVMVCSKVVTGRGDHPSDRGD